MNGDHDAHTERDAVEDPLVDYEALAASLPRQMAHPTPFDGVLTALGELKGKAESLRKKLESLNETIDGPSIHVDKVKGESVSPHPVVDELVLLRTLMEKMRPID
ncbi:unnamed protein product [Vitrella brassicaformis CCMP3155]|uniref:Uncharacterized protein n=1 Tax=Vitrella brassicaformis (strain CCMP3155) TaxID=1169540 RepID=A0A0G4EBQ8_VITBC|nr:unnamed protein product [Vitrella brassicaformis CCMP3155]|eukprot:CEL93080.1 unnamed protein product [Vitrella brassicaformis CCMP3155]